MRLISKSAIVTGAGVVLLGTSLALSSAAAVWGASSPHALIGRVQPAKKSCNTPHFCILEENQNSNGGGIFGLATNDGLYGAATDSYGTVGVAANYAVYGSATQQYGVYGTASQNAIYGTSSGLLSVGTEGVSTGENGVGVVGLEFNGTEAAGVLGESSGFGVYGQSSTASAYPFAGADDDGDLIFTVDSSGDGVFNGYVEAASFKESVPARDGQVSASVALAPRATIEDTGTARMTDGVAVVHLEPDFASTLDLGQGYQVFLTPDGDTRGWLYVAQKFEGGFIVREAEHGRSSVYFDYRVVAHPAGSSDVRLPAYHPKHLRLPKLPSRPPVAQPRLPALRY